MKKSFNLHYQLKHFTTPEYMTQALWKIVSIHIAIKILQTNLRLLNAFRYACIKTSEIKWMH